MNHADVHDQHVRLSRDDRPLRTIVQWIEDGSSLQSALQDRAAAPQNEGLLLFLAVAEFADTNAGAAAKEAVVERIRAFVAAPGDRRSDWKQLAAHLVRGGFASTSIIACALLVPDEVRESFFRPIFESLIDDRVRATATAPRLAELRQLSGRAWSTILRVVSEGHRAQVCQFARDHHLQELSMVCSAEFVPGAVQRAFAETARRNYHGLRETSHWLISRFQASAEYQTPAGPPQDAQRMAKRFRTLAEQFGLFDDQPAAAAHHTAAPPLRPPPLAAGTRTSWLDTVRHLWNVLGDFTEEHRM